MDWRQTEVAPDRTHHLLRGAPLYAGGVGEDVGETTVGIRAEGARGVVIAENTLLRLRGGDQAPATGRS